MRRALLSVAVLVLVGCGEPYERDIDGSGGAAGTLEGSGGHVVAGSGGLVGSGGVLGSGGRTGGGGSGSGGAVGSGGATGSGGHGAAVYLPECVGGTNYVCGGMPDDGTGRRYMWKNGLWNPENWPTGRARCATCSCGAGYQRAFDFSSSAGGEKFVAVCVSNCGECYWE